MTSEVAEEAVYPEVKGEGIRVHQGIGAAFLAQGLCTARREQKAEFSLF